MVYIGCEPSIICNRAMVMKSLNGLMGSNLNAEWLWIFFVR